MSTCIKICPNPHCDAVFHHCPISVKKCQDCETTIKRINEETYWRKFSMNWFQYDLQTGQYYRPVKKTDQLRLEF